MVKLLLQVIMDAETGLYEWQVMTNKGNLRWQSNAGYASCESAHEDGKVFMDRGKVRDGADRFSLGLLDWYYSAQQAVK